MLAVLFVTLPGRKSGFRAGFRPDSRRESLKIGHPAYRRPAVGLVLKFFRFESGRNPARKPDIRPGISLDHRYGERAAGTMFPPDVNALASYRWFKPVDFVGNPVPPALAPALTRLS